MDESATRDRIRRFISSELLWDGTTLELTDEYPLLEKGLDSIGLIEVVSFIEGEFRVDISDDDLLPENFASIASIARLVESKRDPAT